MTNSIACESCGMPIETGRYCQHCVDENGELQSFDERFGRMVAWEARRRPDGHARRIGDRHPRLHGHDAGVA